MIKNHPDHALIIHDTALSNRYLTRKKCFDKCRWQALVSTT